MKRLLSSLAIAAALAFAVHAHAQDYWDDDNWLSDDYGYYDEDFSWETDDARWDSWYGDSDSAWNSYYDDVGDEGLFDV